jgi:hypothetical protein
MPSNYGLLRIFTSNYCTRHGPPIKAWTRHGSPLKAWTKPTKHEHTSESTSSTLENPSHGYLKERGETLFTK